MPSTILVVEDDPIIREVSEATLGGEGYRVVSVQDGEEALEVLPRVRPDLILSDVRMPRCDGFELLRRVRRDRHHCSTPFVIMSAKAETSDQRMGMSLGADDYLTKPYMAADLLRTIEVRLARVALVNDRLRLQRHFLTRVLPHELRTPLAGIIGYADLMVLQGESGCTLTAGDLVDYGQNLGRAGQRLLSIAEDFSLWAWLESETGGQSPGGGTGLRQTQITAEVLRHWCGECASRYGRAGELLIEGPPTTVRVPAEGLQRVIAHLVENALKFSLPGAGVRVSIGGAELACEIRVTDSGRGMSEADLERFGMMRQFDRGKFEQQGIGMGLGLAQKFAQLGGGDFTLVRNLPGPGMTACLKLVRTAG